MSKINNLDFVALNLSGDNYLQWVLDTKFILKSKGLGECIAKDNNASKKDRYKAILIIRHHLIESLKDQYITIENPLDLWNKLKQRYDHQRLVLLPKARYDWMSLRIQDFKSVDEYNSEMFKIVSTLKLCGKEITDEDMLEKTLSTFHTNNMVLGHQYREKGFKSYEDLIPCLLRAEQNNELLMRNSEMRPPGSTPLPEAHAAEEAMNESNHVHHDKPHGHCRGGWRGRGRGQYNLHGLGNSYGRGRGYQFHSGRGRGRICGVSKPQHSTRSVCHRCGISNHWAKNCRTPKHLVDVYQENFEREES